VRALLAALLLLAAPGTAFAQASSCQVPAVLPRPHADEPSADQPRRNVPITGYTLAISWSPEFCHGHQGGGAEFQCGGGARFGFVLHGLWPDGRGDQWPQYCKPTALLPETVLRQALCATPSVQLLQHEYAKHGTCTGLDPASYFRSSNALFAKLRYPDMEALSRRPALTVGQFAAAMARANPGLDAGMMRVTLNKRGWLDEVWLCLGRDQAYRRCPPNSGGAQPNARMKIQRAGA
jgi:ribonuclease T2